MNEVDKVVWPVKRKHLAIMQAERYILGTFQLQTYCNLLACCDYMQCKLKLLMVSSSGDSCPQFHLDSSSLRGVILPIIYGSRFCMPM